MISLLETIFIKLLYQPFFNLLVVFYEGLERFTPNPDMGVAVILFTLALRIILLPLSLSSGESEDEKRKIGLQYETLQKKFRDEPLKLKEAKDELVRKNRRLVRAEIFGLGIQVAIALMLWRIFASGLEGADLHLLYSFVPQPNLPFNLTFLGSIDLSRPSVILNLVASLLLFITETLSLTFSAYPITRNDRIMQVVVPSLVFLYLYNMPAGKKLFIITTLIITILIILLKEIRSVLRLYHRTKS